MGFLSNRVGRNEIKPGDHIYTYRAVFAYSNHATGELWFASSLRSRHQYVGPNPGLPCLSNDPPQESSLDIASGPVDDFCVLLLDPDQVDYLNLKSNERITFGSQQAVDGKKVWVSERINP